MGVYPALFCWFTLHTSETHTHIKFHWLLNPWEVPEGIELLWLTCHRLCQQHSNQHRLRCFSQSLDFLTESWDDALSEPQRASAWGQRGRLGREEGGSEADCSATEGRAGLRNWGRRSTKATIRTGGWTCCHVAQGHKRTRRQKAFREASGRDLIAVQWALRGLRRNVRMKNTSSCLVEPKYVFLWVVTLQLICSQLLWFISLSCSTNSRSAQVNH